MPMRWIVWLGLLVPMASPESLRDGCEPGDQELVQIHPNDTVQVISALAGSELTCYKVTLMRDGKTTVGYVLGEALPAVHAFDHAREEAAAASFEAETQWRRLSSTRSKPAPENSRSTASLPPNMPRISKIFLLAMPLETEPACLAWGDEWSW